MNVLSTENNLEVDGVQRSWTLPSLPIQATFYTSHLQITRIQLSLAEQFCCVIHGSGLESKIFEWMTAYSNREKGPLLPLLFNSFTPFMRNGLRAIQALEIGEVASYGEIAARAGCSKGARAIGNVCNKNPYPLVIPCHRVIQGNGSIGGFAYNLELKKALLSYES